MAKTEKELQELKNKVEELSKELNELTEEELNQISGGLDPSIPTPILGNNPYGSGKFSHVIGDKIR